MSQPDDIVTKLLLYWYLKPEHLSSYHFMAPSPWVGPIDDVTTRQHCHKITVLLLSKYRPSLYPFKDLWKELEQSNRLFEKLWTKTVAKELISLDDARKQSKEIVCFLLLQHLIDWKDWIRLRSWRRYIYYIRWFCRGTDEGSESSPMVS